MCLYVKINGSHTVRITSGTLLQIVDFTRGATVNVERLSVGATRKSHERNETTLNNK